MKTVYCERGAWRPELRELERAGFIRLVHFPYEGRSGRVRTEATPSLITMDTTYVTWDSTILLSDAEPSEKLDDIRRLLGSGRETEFDARHLDSAYKSRCDCFLTCDKGDIASRSEQLEQLLGLKVFHRDTDWDEFRAFVGA